MLKSGRKAFFVILLIGVLALSACGPTDGQQPTQAGQPTQSVPNTADNPTQAEPTTEDTQPTESAPPDAEPQQTQPPAGETESPIATEEPTVEAASVTEFPDPNGYTWAEVVSGLERPLDLVEPPDGSGRLLLVEKPGRILVLQDNNLLPEPFLDIRDRVNINGNEQGLLGIALHPNYQENGYFYLNYTGQGGSTFISRFTTTDDPNRADPGSEKILLTFEQPFENHNGGVVAFGPDGYLYIGTGDGGSRNDPQDNGQSLDTLLGKILRIDVDGGDPYAIPADNPFADGGGRPEIWAYGLRNPWRFSFDSLTGDLYIADVGQNMIEEIDFQPAGAAGGINYGWKYREGSTDANGGPPAGMESEDPVAEYTHADGCSVTGGFVYRGEDLPEFRGVYLYADYCSGKMWGLLRGADGTWQSSELYQLGGRNITSFGQDSRGELYIIDDGGGIYRLQRQ